MKVNLFIIKQLLFCIFIFLGITNIATAYSVPDVWEVLRSELSLNHELSRPEVQQQIKWLVAHPGYVRKACQQSEPYIYHILAEIRKRRLPGELALLPMIESAYNPFAYSVVGAAGLWQLMPGTGSDLGLTQDWWYDGRRSVGPSTDAALNFLVRLNKVFNGNWVLSAAAYDAGEGAVSRAIKANTAPGRSVDFWSLPLPRETREYVPRLLALAEIIRNPGYYKISLPNIPYLPYFTEVNIGSQIDLNHAAKLAGISYTELIKLNPGYNRWTTAPYKPFRLLIPAEKVERFNLNLANFPEEKRVSWIKHQVQQGDSLNNIATRYHTTVNLIKQLNQLTSNFLKPNQSILIPSSRNTAVVAKKESTVSLLKPTRPIIASQVRRVIHIVQTNDSFQTIQEMYDVSEEDIQNWNHLSGNYPLVTGQQLTIWKKAKQPIYYIVKAGDSLSAIARLHNAKLNTIIGLNPGISKDRPLYKGQKIQIG